MVFDNRIYNEMEQGENLNTKTYENLGNEADIAPNTDLSDEIQNEDDMRAAFANIRAEVSKSMSSADLSELFRQAGALIKLLEHPPFETKVGDDLDAIRATAEQEFAVTAQELNQRASEIGARSHYAEKWGE